MNSRPGISTSWKSHTSGAVATTSFFFVFWLSTHSLSTSLCLPPRPFIISLLFFPFLRATIFMCLLYLLFLSYSSYFFFFIINFLFQISFYFTSYNCDLLFRKSPCISHVFPRGFLFLSFFPSIPTFLFFCFSQRAMYLSRLTPRPAAVSPAHHYTQPSTFH